MQTVNVVQLLEVTYRLLQYQRVNSGSPVRDGTLDRSAHAGGRLQCCDVSYILTVND